MTSAPVSGDGEGVVVWTRIWQSANCCMTWTKPEATEVPRSAAALEYGGMCW
jgi:hypothetical protein